MSAQPGTIETCEKCEININGALCSDDCEIYQDLKAEYEYEMEKESINDTDIMYIRHNLYLAEIKKLRDANRDVCEVFIPTERLVEAEEYYKQALMNSESLKWSEEGLKDFLNRKP